jgi:hypothetical protein
MDYFISPKEESKSKEGLVTDFLVYENPRRTFVLWGFFVFLNFYTQPLDYQQKIRNFAG